MKARHIVLASLLSCSLPAWAQQPPVDVSARELYTIMEERSKAVAQRFDAQEKATEKALAAAKEAVSKAETAAEKRFDAVNEFRASLKDQQATLIPRAEAEVRLKSLDIRVADSEARITQIVSRAEGSAQLWQGISVFLGICFAAATLAIAFRKRTTEHVQP